MSYNLFTRDPSLSVKFYATLPPGLEDIAANEVEELGGRVFERRMGKGRIFFEGSKRLIASLNSYSRTLERVNVLLYRGNISTLDEIYHAVKKLDFGFMEGRSFAIRSMRAGKHDFTSMDIARVAGQAVIDSFMESYGARLKVNLSTPDVILRVEVVEDELFIGLDTTGDDALHKRWWRVYNHPAHLNATIACAMLRIAGWSKEESLVDPMCGSGTIPIEAALMARGVVNKRDFIYRKLCEMDVEERSIQLKVDLHGIEKFKKHLEGAIRNAENAGVLDTITFLLGDATRLEGDYDVIITNPPYGLRIWKKSAIKKLYEKFTEAAGRCMHDESRMVVITAEHRLFERAAQNAGLSLIHERFVKYGGLITKILLYSLS